MLMSTPPNVPSRGLLHTRKIVCTGYARSDGLFDIEGHLRDISTEGTDLFFKEVAAGGDIHAMRVVMTVDADMVKRNTRRYLSTQFETQRIQIFDEKNQAHQVELPTSALRLLVDILSELADGNAVKVVPIHAELTTQEAADMLNVSRPHLVKLLESGALPFHKAGKHRRIRFAELMAFKAARDRASAQAMEELAKQAQELRLGYE